MRTVHLKGSQLIIALSLMLAACGERPVRDAQQPGSGNAAVRTTPEAEPAVTPVMPPSVRDLVDQLPTPGTGTPTVATRFTRDTVAVGEAAHLVTVTWFPRSLRDGLRRMPTLTQPLISGKPTFNQQVPVANGVRLNGGTVYDLYVSWRVVPTLHAGRIDASPAVIAYEPPASRGFVLAPAAPLTVRSLPAVLIVRAHRAS